MGHLDMWDGWIGVESTVGELLEGEFEVHCSLTITITIFETTMIKLIILIICFGRFASYRVYSLCSQRNLSKSKSKSNQINLEIIVFFYNMCLLHDYLIILIFPSV